MSGVLPAGWAQVTVAEVADDISYGFTAKSSSSTVGSKYLRITDIQNGSVDWAGVPFCVVPREKKSSYQLHPGDVVFARTGATTGKSYLITSCPDAVFASYLIRVRPSPAVLPELLSFFFTSAAYWQQISENVSGSAQPNCNASKLSALTIGLPPSKEQQRIVAKLEVLLANVKRLQERIQEVPRILRRFRQSVLSAACAGRLTADWRAQHGTEGQAKRLSEAILAKRKQIWEKRQRDLQRKARYPEPFRPSDEFDLDLPASWSNVTVSQLAFLDVGFAFKSADFAESGVRLLRGENVEPGRLRWTDTKYWPAAANDGFDHLLISEGEIILALDRPLISSGLKIARAKKEDIPCLLVQRVMRFKMAEERVTPWLYYNLQLPRFISHLAHGMTGSDLPHVTGTGVAEFTIGLPPLEEQQEIIKRVDSMFALADRLEARYAKAKGQVERITPSLIAKAFRGELVPTEAELAKAEGRSYESAAQLLERINGSHTEPRQRTRTRMSAKRA